MSTGHFDKDILTQLIRIADALEKLVNGPKESTGGLSELFGNKK